MDEIKLKPCPFCGASVSAFRGTGNVTFFLCSNEECRSLVSFGGNKQVAPDAVEAENPIIDWTDNDVWEFLHHYGCSANPLYQCGERRIGCIGCPMQGGKGMKADFTKYPIYRANYVKAFDRMIEKHKRLYLQRDTSWETGEEVMRWWVGDDPRQITLEDMQW